MKAAFIHDHIFPCYNGEFYESSGFDNVFINRYLNIFDKVRIIARNEELTETPKPKFEKLKNDNLEFCTFVSSKQVLSVEGRKKIKNYILECDYAVIRVPSVLGLVAADICIKNKVPYVMEVVGCPWDAVSTRGLKWIIPALGFTYFTRRTVNKAKYVVYVTEKFLEKRYPTKGKYIPCSNVTLENYGTVDMQKRAKKISEFDKKEELLIGTCASVDTVYKAQDDVIKAMALLKQKGINIRYQLAGGGDQSRIGNVISKYKLEDSVEFVGELKHSDVFAWLDSLDIYVHPSKQEGLCRAIKEAMSRGCPILAADAGGVHEQIQEECIFGKGDYNGLCKKILSINRNKMTQYSNENYKNASRYQSSVLYERRNHFFADFIEENR
jgi:glycosyltransferase involved in cell wall biosynthesis